MIIYTYLMYYKIQQVLLIMNNLQCNTMHQNKQAFKIQQSDQHIRVLVLKHANTPMGKIKSILN